MTAKSLKGDVVLFKPAVSRSYARKHSRGSSGGVSRFVARNKQAMVEVFFRLKKKPKAVSLTIQDAAGKVLETLSVKPQVGLNRAVWSRRSRGRARLGGSALRGGMLIRDYSAVLVVDGVTMSAPVRTEVQQ